MKKISFGKSLISIFISILFLFGCPKKTKLQLPETKSQEVSQEQQQEQEPSIRGGEFTNVEELKNVYFNYDSFELTNDAKKTLDVNAKYLISNPNLEVLVEGHCCECGTNEYNLGLGQKRANVVREFYINLGVPANRIATISYGEEKPINKNVAPPDNSKCVPNRRVETKVRTKK